MSKYTPAQVKTAAKQLFTFQAPLGVWEECTEHTQGVYERRALRILEAADAAGDAT